MADGKVVMLVVVLSFGVVALVTEVEGALSYGEICNINNSDCNVQQGTVCKEREGSNVTVCRCESKDYSWNPMVSICVALVNDQAICNPRSFDGTPAIPCTENARCLKNATGIYRCVCGSKYSADSDGFCKPSFGAQCRTDQDECNFDEYLSCMSGNNTCGCRLAEMEYFEDTGCVVKIGGSCSPVEGVGSPPCINSERSNCTENVCQCAGNFKPTPDMARCVIYHNETCTVDNECGDTLKCRDANGTATPTVQRAGRNEFADFEDTPVGPLEGKACMCEPGVEVWNEEAFRCEILAGSNCTMDRCVRNAECSAGVCQCVGGTKADGGICKGLQNFTCAVEDDCLKSDYLTCSNDKKCACDAAHPTSYNGFCVGGTGSTCASSANCDRVTSQCLSGTCRCKDGYTEDNAKDKACFAARGTSCIGDGDCYSPAFLGCVESKCDCFATEEWESEKCHIAASESCENPRENMPCIGNSTCEKDANNDLKCMCGSGFKLDEAKRRCVSGAGGLEIFSFSLLAPLYVILKSL